MRANALKTLLRAVLPSTAIFVAACNAPPPAPAPLEPLPSTRQLAWHEQEFYAFVHFNMNTFTGIEWGHGSEDPKQFHPTALDCDQWAALFAECGLTGIIITAKHHDGFCLWPSEYTEHDVARSDWREGRGDVIADLAEACRRHGLWLGVYISPWDRNNPIYGRDDEAYNAYFIGQMQELLGGYGEIREVWWDGANGDRNNPDKHQEYDWPAFVQTVRRTQPEAVIFSPAEAGGDVRWVGNERGYAGETQWASFEVGPQEERMKRLNEGVEGGRHWFPAETDVSIRPGWFWSPESDDRVKHLDQLLEIYYHSVGYNTNLLLNFPVDARGLVHENDAAALRALHEILALTFDQDLARGANAHSEQVRGAHARYAASNLTDGDPDTYWTTDDELRAASAVIEFDRPSLLNRVLLQEHIELGQRVRAWSLEARVAGGWQAIAEGSTIGHKRIARFDTVMAEALRLSIEDSLACPVLENFEAYLAPAEVRIRPEARVFLGSTQVEILCDQPDASIHYTLDGSPPGPETPRYQSPLMIDRSLTIRAVAVRHGQRSPRETSEDLVAYQVGKLRPAVHFIRAPRPGLSVEIYEDGWQSLDQMATREPTQGTRAAQVSPEPRTRNEHVALAFDAFIQAPRDGVYEFFLSSDDGSRLYLGEERLIDLDGLHGMLERSAAIGLSAGYHPIRVEWFNATGGLGLRLQWQGPGIERQDVPATALFHD